MNWTWLDRFDTIAGAIISGVFGALLTAVYMSWQQRRREKKENSERNFREQQEKIIHDKDEQTSIEKLFDAIKDIKEEIVKHKHRDLEVRIKGIEDSHNSCQIKTQKTLENLNEKFKDFHDSFQELKKLFPLVNQIQNEMTAINERFQSLEKVTGLEIKNIKENIPNNRSKVG